MYLPQVIYDPRETMTYNYVLQNEIEKQLRISNHKLLRGVLNGDFVYEIVFFELFALSS